mgnify:CR=1 FL=1|tara:strand:+ start:1235 stop:1474 length:240 start_codon:yes stop_codon:yes gene_type:complete
MMEWMQSNWMGVIGAFAVVGGGLYLPFVRRFVLMGLKTMVSEAVLKKIAIQIIGKFVKSSKNNLDDVWFAEFKKKINND